MAGDTDTHFEELGQALMEKGFHNYCNLRETYVPDGFNRYQYLNVLRNR